MYILRCTTSEKPNVRFTFIGNHQVGASQTQHALLNFIC